MKVRILTLTALLLIASGIPASAVTLASHSYCGTSCGQLGTARGSGTLIQQGTGVTLGSVASGTIALLDRSNDGARDFTVYGWSRRWTQNGMTYFSGSGMTFRAWTSWKVTIKATSGASVTTTAKGWGWIKGSGTQAWQSSGWSLNGNGGSNSGNWPKWPTSGHSFTIAN